MYFEKHSKVFNLTEETGVYLAINPMTIHQWRPHGLAVSRMVTLVQVIVLVSMLLFDVAQEVFTSAAFRRGVVAAVLAAVFLSRKRRAERAVSW